MYHLSLSPTVFSQYDFPIETNVDEVQANILFQFNQTNAHNILQYSRIQLLYSYILNHFLLIPTGLDQ